MEYGEEKVKENPLCTMNIKFGADMVYPPYDLYPKLRVKELRCIFVRCRNSIVILVLKGAVLIKSHQIQVGLTLLERKSC